MELDYCCHVIMGIYRAYTIPEDKMRTVVAIHYKMHYRFFNMPISPKRNAIAKLP